ncbi:hypothetical protein PIB30_053089 [Stylosanthes scabra]|uniref:Uncharacterized protein n=1 Tax=Stylosanthes scabra TaxID=79078 RepID=A0ABU6QHW1_9FABA|nr:hypothetical protein [Stylosanthes scabra]
MAPTTVIGLKQCDGSSKAISYSTTGDITCPIKYVVTENDKGKDGMSKSKGDTDNDFVDKLEDWDSSRKPLQLLTKEKKFVAIVTVPITFFLIVLLLNVANASRKVTLVVTVQAHSAITVSSLDT